jgi:hypothetical protein
VDLLAVKVLPERHVEEQLVRGKAAACGCRVVANLCPEPIDVHPVLVPADEHDSGDAEAMLFQSFRECHLLGAAVHPEDPYCVGTFLYRSTYGAMAVRVSPRALPNTELIPSPHQVDDVVTFIELVPENDNAFVIVGISGDPSSD